MGLRPVGLFLPKTISPDLRIVKVVKRDSEYDRHTAKSDETGPYNYQKALYTGKHFYLPKSAEKTHARRGLYALWITMLCVLHNKDVYIWQEKVYNPLT